MLQVVLSVAWSSMQSRGMPTVDAESGGTDLRSETSETDSAVTGELDFPPCPAGVTRASSQREPKWQQLLHTARPPLAGRPSCSMHIHLSGVCDASYLGGTHTWEHTLLRCVDWRSADLLVMIHPCPTQTPLTHAEPFQIFASSPQTRLTASFD